MRYIQNINKTILLVLILLAVFTRSSSPFFSKIPWGHDPYLYGGATVNLVNEWTIPGALPYSYELTFGHLEDIVFLLFKLILSDMKIVLNILPAVLGIIDILGLFLFVKALTKEDSIAVLSSFFLVFNSFHASTTPPEGLALGFLFLSMYLLLENKVPYAGIVGGLIFLTDYLIFGHFLIVIVIYLITNFNKKNFKNITIVLILTLLIATPWQIYLNSISKGSTLSGNVGSIQPQDFIIFNPKIISDTVYVLPFAITPLHVFFVLGGLYFARKREYFQFLSLCLIFFFVISLANTKFLGTSPTRHIISLSVFSSIISAVFLDYMKNKRILFTLLILLSILSYFAYSIDHYAEIPNETLIASNWLKSETPQNALISAPSVVYAVFSGKTIVYETDPCKNREVDYVIEDRNLQKYPVSYGSKGKVLNIRNYSCLELVYITENIDIFSVTKSVSGPK
jgi:hypothetical protein